MSCGLLLYAATHVQQVAQTINAVSGPLVFLERPGPAAAAEAAPADRRAAAARADRSRRRPAQIDGRVPNPADTPPPPEMNIPVITAQATEMLPGALTASMDGTALGTRDRTRRRRRPRCRAAGRAKDPGRAQVRRAGFGGDAFGPGNGVSPPQLIKEVKPNYTADAMRAKLQGVVEMQAVVLPDGSVDPSRIRITRSLDAAFGLDQQAIIAVKQWRFRPGMRSGQAVASWVTVELTFTLR